MSAPKKIVRRRQSQHKILAMILVGVGLFILGAVALVFLSRAKTSAAFERYASVVPVAVNFPAPALELSDLQGNSRSLKDYRGQVVLVNNWATWCPPCRAEMPALEAFFQDFRDQGFMLVGVEAGDSQADVSKFVEDYSISFPIWLDPHNDSLRGFYNASLPNSYVVDRDGKVVLGWTGTISRDMLEKHVAPLLEN
jgi:peroxiredoxin